MAFVGLTSNDEIRPAATLAGSRPFADPKTFTAPVRVQRNVLASSEGDVLRLLSAMLPGWVKPDHLTMLGLVGMLIACAAYIASNWHPATLFLASLGLLLNWFGDSLDGTLARYRHIERPRYGYFLDHSIDACGNFLLLFGLGASPFVDMDVALFALTGYLLLSIYSFLTCHVSGTFHLTFLGCGPSEMRLALVLLNAGMFVLGPQAVPVFGHPLSIYSLLVGGFGLLFLIVFAIRTADQARDLRRHDPGAASMPQHGKRRATDRA